MPATIQSSPHVQFSIMVWPLIFSSSASSTSLFLLLLLFHNHHHLIIIIIIIIIVIIYHYRCLIVYWILLPSFSLWYSLLLLIFFFSFIYVKCVCVSHTKIRFSCLQIPLSPPCFPSPSQIPTHSAVTLWEESCPGEGPEQTLKGDYEKKWTFISVSPRNCIVFRWRRKENRKER